MTADQLFDRLAGAGRLREEHRRDFVEIHRAGKYHLARDERTVDELVSATLASADVRRRMRAAHGSALIGAPDYDDRHDLDARVRAFQRETGESNYTVALDRLLARDEFAVDLTQPAPTSDAARGLYDGLTPDELDRKVRARMVATGETDYIKALDDVTTGE